MAAIFLTTPKTNDRLAQLWEELRSDPVPLQPETKQARTTVESSILLRQDERFPSMTMDDHKSEVRSWRVDLAKLFHSLLEPEVTELPPTSTVEAIPEGEAFEDVSMAAAHEASLELFTPFRWEPKPGWIDSPARQFSNTVHPQRFAQKPKIPLRPLHKQPFYKRPFFYLRRSLNGSK